MPDSRKRQRRVEKPVFKLTKRRVRHSVLTVAMEEPDAHPPEVLRQVEKEILYFTDSECPGFEYAPLPSDRGDLRIEYARIRLDDFEGTIPEEVARDLQPTPEEMDEIRRCREVIDHKPRYEDSERAFRSLHARKRRRP